MNSLVGYGVSSDSDSDEEGNADGDGSINEVRKEAVAAKKTRNFLLESGSTSSDSDNESELEEKNPDPAASSARPRSLPKPAAAGCCEPSLPSPVLDSPGPNKLPPPPLNACSTSSVFLNPFKAQAMQKLSALQKHVPLTTHAKPSQIGGKRMCVSYRKDGRCRFGIKCKFAHDSDIQTPVVSSSPGDHLLPQCVGDEESCDGGSNGAESQKLREEENSGGQQVKKRKVGLSNTLIPPKRAMKQYAMFRDRDRANMS